MENDMETKSVKIYLYNTHNKKQYIFDKIVQKYKFKV